MILLHNWRHSLYYLIIWLVLSLSGNSEILADKSRRPLRIAAGSVLEGYYSIGLRLCNYISAANEGIRCEVVPTSGSLENLNLLNKGEVDFAFAQSNLALDAYHGRGEFADSNNTKNATTNLYQLLNLHNEIFTVIVKDKDKILTFADLEGKKISNGTPKSDSTIPYLILAQYYNFKNPPIDIELKHEEYGDELCLGNIDGIIMMTGHPNSLVNYITHACETDFVTIEPEKIDLLLKHQPGFIKVKLQGQTQYPGIDQDYHTIGVGSIFVTNNKVEQRIVKNFLHYFKGREEYFKLVHPTLHNLESNHFTKNFILPRYP
jgi:TRAP transporter TAXI family solute receptor